MPTDRDDTANIDLLIRRQTLQILQGVQISEGNRSRIQTSISLFENQVARDSDRTKQEGECRELGRLGEMNC